MRKVVAGLEETGARCDDCIKYLDSLGTCSVDLIVGSPPYPGKARRYKSNVSGNLQDGVYWSEWFAEVMHYASCITKGYAFFVVNGTVRDGTYDGAVEKSVARAMQRGVRFDRPLIWHKNAPPNRKDYFGNDWEYILAVKNVDAKNIYFDWESIGTPPKYKAGGRFRQRTSNGERRLGSEYPQGKITRPRDVLRVLVGGGHMGSKLAHDNEAPFPEALVEPLIKAFVPPGGIVCDPFLGSGTTAAVATRLDRRWCGCDCRQSQVDLTNQRVKEVEHSREQE